MHKNATLRVSFQRTFRIPDDGKEYYLPPGFGDFPLVHVDDYASKVPDSWKEHGGVMMPMAQSEALWISFSSCGGRDWNDSYCFAVKIAAGKINALTGEPWSDKLQVHPQDYLLIPEQPWLDGFCVEKGVIRQFVAMPLGQGYTAEEQITGQAEHGGLQIIVYPMKRKRYKAERRLRKAQERYRKDLAALREGSEVCAFMCAVPEGMGLAPGGLMKQEIYEDKYGYEAWDKQVSSRCFVHILNSAQWHQVTGKPAPGTPITAEDYEETGLPWFDYYDESCEALDGSDTLAKLDSVASKAKALGQPLSGNEAIEPKLVVSLTPESLKPEAGKKK